MCICLKAYVFGRCTSHVCRGRRQLWVMLLNAVYHYFWDNVFTQPGTFQVGWAGWPASLRDDWLISDIPGLGLQDRTTMGSGMWTRTLLTTIPPGHRPPWLPLLPSSISPFTCLNNVLYKEATRSTLSHHSPIQWKLNNMNEMARSRHWTMTGGHDPWDGKSR